VLKPLLERAGQMLLKSGLNNDLSILLLSEKDPLKRWCEFVSGGGDLRVDENGYDRDKSGTPIDYVSGRLLDAVSKSSEKCVSIVVKLT
jgi:hypothetical protein